MSLIAVVLFGYISFLVTSNYRNQIRLQQSILEHLVDDVEKKAADISFLFGEIKEKLQVIPRSALQTYFDNKSLGMSMRYGLRASLAEIQKEFKSIIENETLDGHPIFTRIVFVDKEERPVVETPSDTGPRAKPARRLIPENAHIGIQAHHDKTNNEIIIRIYVPYHYKNEYEGMLIASISSRSLHGHFIKTINTNHRSAFLLPDENRVGPFLEDKFEIKEGSMATATHPNLTNITQFTIIHGDGAKTPMLAVAAGVKETPLTLLEVIPEIDILGDSAPIRFLIGMALLAVGIVIALGFITRTHSRNLVLNTRLAEESRMKAKIEAKNLELEKSEKKFREIFDNAFEGMFQLTADGRFLSANRSMAKILGFDSAEELITFTSDTAAQYHLYPTNDCKLSDPQDPQDSIFRYEKKYKRKNGSAFWGTETVRAVRDETGGLLYYEGSLVDVTERIEKERAQRQQEKAEAATRAKSRFLANMSHEIRTPMNAVIGMAHLALRTKLTAQQADYIKKIKLSADALLGIINDILDFSKVEAGRLSLECIDFHLDDVLDALADLVVLKAEEKGLELIFSIAPDVPLNLVGDPLRLGQVLTNLANNAVKFTDQGEVLICAEVKEKRNKDVILCFTVTDSGIGISLEEMGRLFQSFTQADDSVTRKFGGTGLGLTICKHLVEMMGGTIRVESQPGQGSSFFFTGVFGLGEEKPRNSLLPAVDLRGLKVLVVDDNATAAEVLVTMLSALAFEVSTVSSGEEALRIIDAAAATQEIFDLVLMDWKMPGLDGIETSRLIKNRYDTARAPAVLMVTAYDLEEVKTAAMAAGINAFLTKPVNQSLLFDAVMKVFGKNGTKRKSRRLAYTPDQEQLEAIRGAEVLLVEDNDINRQVAMELLTQAGLKVDTAVNGLEAVAAVAEKNYDLVLMDIQMPVLDGLEATRQIRGSEQFAHLPVVAMTAHAIAGDREKSLQAGMNDHVTKPIDPDELMGVLVQWIKPGKRQVPSPLPVRPQQKENNEKLPSFATLDAAEGLKRTGGKTRFYKKLLKDFHGDYCQAIPEMERDLAANNLENVRRAAHTIKSVAGNIGAMHLFETAANLELALNEEEPAQRAATLYPPFAEALRAVLAELNQLPETAPAAQNAKADAPLDRAKARKLIHQLSALLEEGNSEAEDLLPLFRDTMTLPEVAAVVDTVIVQTENLDFDEALETLNRLSAELGLDPKQ